MKYRIGDRNQLANCMLLTREENGAGAKSDKTPDEWFSDKDTTYLEMHLIPNDNTLWGMDQYEDFIEARKNLIRKRFEDLLAKSMAAV